MTLRAASFALACAAGVFDPRAGFALLFLWVILGVREHGTS
jgi:hypothetical protein